MEITTVLILILGLAAGFGLGYLLAKSKKGSDGEETQKLRLQLEMEQKRNAQSAEEIKFMNEELRQERERIIDLNSQKSRLESDFRNLQERLNDQKKEVEDLQAKFKETFENLANKIFEEKSEKFTSQNKTNLGELLNPLKERIETFEKKVDQNSKDSLQWNTSLKAELSNLKDLNQKITKEAENLTKALKGDSKAQGNWGEMQLESILEKVGLLKDTHYFKEKNFKSENGSNQRLDYIIKLPDDKYLVLDSKVSLTAYSNYFDHEGTPDQEKYLKQHLDSINGHIKILGEKNYQNLYDIQQPDFVLMFVANEPALTIALKEDPALYEKALDKNIVLVSTSTLLATMRTVSYIWKQDLQSKNALEIARQAGALYDKFVGFTEDLLKVGNNLRQTKDNYDLAMNKLSQGTGNLVRRTEVLRELGAKTSKQNDQRLIDRSVD
ncbi:DNA recombination protein RmuC [Marinoscillum sp. MHG1-6]|uniref:DNA recombination protein RmuC n=1 Tax=Marinoscillum sp. MHG1-6 TaxID=2959627 RepID=UPI002157A914|nr:DNA recombination protein RmuC [Marinoscillum sp. MHG1-6]